jgi:uncharacterized protein (TIGR03435 family)
MASRKACHNRTMTCARRGTEVRLKRLFTWPAVLLIALTIPATSPARAQAVAAPSPTPKAPQLDVISVKPDKNEDASMGLTGDGLTARGATLHWLLTEAFQVNADQLAGEPSWSTSDRWAIDAKVVREDVPLLTKLTMAQRLGMYQQVLTDRFQLKYHHEQRDRSTYAFVIAKGGPRLTASNAEIVAQATQHPGRPGNLQMGRGLVSGEGTTMHFLAIMLSRQLGRNVVDKTGLTGRYDFKLTWTPEDAAPPAPQSPEPGADLSVGLSLFAAVQDQLGLKLESIKGPVDIVVIDHVEKPTAN